MKIENIKHVETEQDWQNETTREWYTAEVDGEEMEFAWADCNGEVDILDADGCPMHGGVADALHRAIES